MACVSTAAIHGFSVPKPATSSGSASGAPAWYAQRWMDADARAWQEIDLSRLARDPAFLQIGT